jgi:Putative adhesin
MTDPQREPAYGTPTETPVPRPTLPSLYQEPPGPNSTGHQTGEQVGYEPPPGYSASGHPHGAVATAPPPVVQSPPAPVTPQRPPGVLHASGIGAVRVIGGLVVAGLVATGAMSVLSHFFSQTERATDTFSTPVTRLVTDVGTGDVHVRPAPAGQKVTTVQRTLHWSFTKPTLKQETTGGTLALTSSCSGSWFGNNCAVDLDVLVPAGATLELQASTGDITATSAGGAVTVKSSTGDVSVTTTGTENVDAHTSTGDVTVKGDGTGALVSATSSTGDVGVSLSGVPGRVTADTSTGDVTVTVPRSDYAVTTDTGTGDTRVDVPQDNTSTHKIEAHSSTGDVTVRPL